MHGFWAAALLASALPTCAWAQEADSAGPPASTTAADTTADAGATSADGVMGSLPVPPVTFTAYVDLAQGYDFNSVGQTGGSGDDTFTRGRAGFVLHYDKPRLRADATYDLTGEYWSRFHSLNHLSQRLGLNSRLTVIPEMLFINANAFATPTELTRTGNLSASGEPNSRFNSRDTYGYVVRPEFLLRFKDFATSNLSASHGGVFFVKPSTGNPGTPPPITPAENAYSNTLTEELTSGTYFERLQWSLIGSYGQYSQTTRTETQEEGLANLTYAVTRAFRVFAIGGYSRYKATVSLTRDLSGPTALGGFTYTPGPDLYFTAEGGTQHNFPTYMGSANWMITPFTTFRAQATDEVTTPQGDLLSRLGQGGGLGGLDGYGGYGGIGGGLGLGSYGGYSPFGSHGLALDNSIYRIRSIDGSLIHSVDRMRYAVSIFASERDRLDDTISTPIFPRRTSVYGIRGDVSRQFSQHLTGMLGVAYSRSNEFGGHDHIISANAQLTYRLSDTIDLYLSDNFVHRSSSNQFAVQNGSMSNDQVLIGIRARF